MNFESWRDRARDLLNRGVHPRHAHWEDQPSLLGDDDFELRPLTTPHAQKEFLDLAQFVACARAPDRWALLYRLIYRLNHESRDLLNVLVDADVMRARDLERSVKRDLHKMHAFVRFKQTEFDSYVAWHQPEHLILEKGAEFFVRRFGDKPWSIFTPDLSAHWDLEKLIFTDGIPQSQFTHTDNFDEVWKTYYKSIFNPARLKIKAMRAEMSPKYWRSLPEAEVIRDLIRETPKRLQNMAAAPRYQAKVDASLDWPSLKREAASCLACPIGQEATQIVFGEGNLQADLMIVGEQPGNEEDLAGHVFVGPAGEVLSEALFDAGIARDEIYVTNAVKHFKFVRTDTKMRLHKKPTGAEMHACKPWLEAEIAKVRPRVILALGATAGTALYGRLVKIQEERGVVNEKSPYARQLLISWHPAAILRASSEEEKRARLLDLKEDLVRAWAFAQD